LSISLFFDQRKISCDAIIAASDLTAIGTMKALERRGFEIPKDIALAGFDDINESRFT
jgi:DNA-binding LacI/PurR family transcriptional regulator